MKGRPLYARIFPCSHCHCSVGCRYYGYLLPQIQHSFHARLSLVGFIAGPGMFRLIPQSHATDYLGEIGIVFLMFSIGLEFSLPKLKAMRRLVFGLGGLQVIITMLSIMGILMAMGTPFNWRLPLRAH